MRFSNFSGTPTKDVSAVSDISIPTPKSPSSITMQGDVVNKQGDRFNLSTYQRNELYRQARDLKSQIEEGLCSKQETRIANDKNVEKMLKSEFPLEHRIGKYKKIMRAIGADPKDYNTEKLRRR